MTPGVHCVKVSVIDCSQLRLPMFWPLFELRPTVAWARVAPYSRLSASCALHSPERQTEGVMIYSKDRQSSALNHQQQKQDHQLQLHKLMAVYKRIRGQLLLVQTNGIRILCLLNVLSNCAWIVLGHRVSNCAWIVLAHTVDNCAWIVLAHTVTQRVIVLAHTVSNCAWIVLAHTASNCVSSHSE